MTASRLPAVEAPAVESRHHSTPLVSPVVDYEPPPVSTTSSSCPPPTSAALHRHTPRPLRPVTNLHGGVEPPPPRAAAVFADAALRRVLEVSDRRRPVAALQPLLAAPLVDGVVAMSRTPSREGAAVLRRVRVRTATTIADEAIAAEMFGTFTRGARVHAIAGRIEVTDGRWRVVALQIG